MRRRRRHALEQQRQRERCFIALALFVVLFLLWGE
jgi:hypothetical protein